MQELHDRFAGAVVEDVAQPRGRDDLLLVLAHDGRRHLLHLAPGGARARVTITGRRFGKGAFATGPHLDALRTRLRGAVLRACGHAAGERRCWLEFTAADVPLTLHCELFSKQGLWCLVDASQRVLELSRVVRTAVRTLGPGDVYGPPPPLTPAPPEPAPRFPAPVLAAVDVHFTALDRRTEATAERDELARALDRAGRRATQQCDGLRQQIEGRGDAARIRAEADLLLAYGHAVRRGQDHLLVPDPAGEGELRLELDPALPVPLQAKARYDRARRLEDGATVAAQRLQEAETLAATVQELAARLAAATDDDLAGLRARLHELRLLPRPAATAGTPGASRAKARHAARTVGRQFTSAEGYPILVGRSNEENDRLSLRVARGNDVWLHVGGGRAGSHVIVRLPKGRTASLETLLDAAHVAIHFSKARGEHRCPVVYTEARHVRKPKGLPPGRVVPHQVRELSVTRDEARLQRVLASGGEPM